MNFAVKPEYERELICGKTLEPGRSSFYGSGKPSVLINLDTGTSEESIPEALRKRVIDLPLYTL